MKLVPWDPLGDINRSLPSRMLARWSQLLNDDNTAIFQWTPTTDISETDTEYLIRAELPAVRKEDVRVTVDGGVISIEGERRQNKEDKSETFHRVESFHGTFTRRFALPDNVDVNNIKCEDKDGVLTIHMPKTETAKQQKPIQIKVQ
jgi:HSP20 family protein